MEAEKQGKTVIAEDVEIVGSVKSASDIEINGKLDGDLTCTGKVAVGESATIKGSMTVDSVSIQGKVNGNVAAKDRIEMKSSARVDGDIRAKRLTVEDGVTFIGKSEVNPSGSPSSPSAESKPPAAKSSGASPETAPDSRSDDSGKAEEKKSGVFGRK